MAYGTLKCDNITFTNGGIDQTVTVSGIVQSISGNITATGTIQAATIIGTSTVSGATVTGDAGVFTTVTGGSAGFTTVTGTTVTGTTANFTTLSGTTITGSIGNFGSGSAAAPSVSVGTTDNGIYSPGADQVAISTNGIGRLFVASNGNVGVGVASASQALEVSGNIAFSANTGSSRTLGPALSSDTTLVLRAGSTTGEGANIELGRDEIVYVDAAQHVFRSTNGGSERMRLDSSGRLGLGTSSPRALLHVAGGHSNTANSFIASNLYFDGAWKYINNGYAAALKLANGAGYVSFETAPQNTSGADASATLSTRLVITPSGNVGIGTTSPGFNLDVSGAGTQTIRSVTTDVSGSAIGRFRAFYTGGGGGTQTAIDLRAGDGYGYLLAESNAPLLFGTNNTERARIDSSGRLLVGTSSARTNYLGGGTAPSVQLEATNFPGSSLSLTRNETSGAGGGLLLGRTRGASNGSNTAVAQDDGLGIVSFQGADGTNLIEGARISAAVDGTPGANDMPGRLVFSTTADGASSPTERMRITSTGAVTVGGTSTDPVGASASQVFACGPGASQGAINYYNSSNVCLKIGRGDDGALVTFFRNQPAVTQVGSISVTTTATAYNTSSDYRLKENVTPVTDGITRLQQLKPSRFNFIADPAKTVDGFIAHEVQTIVPEAITGEKDAVDEDGNPIYQGIDQSKLVPLLTAALQEAVAKIESLEARLTAAGI